LVEGLAAHVDVWLAETLGSTAEAQAVRVALDRAGSTLPLWVAYTLNDDQPSRLRSGEPVGEAVRAAVDLGAVAVLFNCSQAERVTEAIDATVMAIPSGVETGGYANRFLAGHSDDEGANAGLSGLRDLSPTAYSELVGTWLDRGATVVGGCCGIEPAHIAELDALRRSRS
jgi:S-methylmethionine-dependent homocysteine/selenocysteine methylase